MCTSTCKGEAVQERTGIPEKTDITHTHLLIHLIHRSGVHPLHPTTTTRAPTGTAPLSPHVWQSSTTATAVCDAIPSPLVCACCPLVPSSSTVLIHHTPAAATSTPCVAPTTCDWSASAAKRWSQEDVG
jgi:hypothetical protein